MSWTRPQTFLVKSKVNYLTRLKDNKKGKSILKRSYNKIIDYKYLLKNNRGSKID